MKKIALTAAFTALAPLTAVAQESCTFGTVWSEARQECVSYSTSTADAVENYGHGWWIQPATDAFSSLVRQAEGCEYGCSIQE